MRAATSTPAAHAGQRVRRCALAGLRQPPAHHRVEAEPAQQRRRGRSAQDPVKMRGILAKDAGQQQTDQADQESSNRPGLRTRQSASDHADDEWDKLPPVQGGPPRHVAARVEVARLAERHKHQGTWPGRSARAWQGRQGGRRSPQSGWAAAAAGPGCWQRTRPGAGPTAGPRRLPPTGRAGGRNGAGGGPTATGAERQGSSGRE